jgi:hypothetical protein
MSAALRVLGTARRTALAKISWLLLVVVTSVPLDKKMAELSTIKRTTQGHKRTGSCDDPASALRNPQQLFIPTATEFFGFLGRLAPPVVRSHSLSARIAAY